MDELKAFLKKQFPKKIQMFDSPSLSGDYREEIYDKNGITVLYSYYYEYIEIYGLEEKQFDEINKEFGI